jgi:hypothetical protein
MGTSPLTVPAPVGVKVTLTVHDIPAPTLPSQVLVWENSTDPVSVMLAMLKAVLPALVRVVGRDLV